MEGLDRLNYEHVDVSDTETDVGITHKQTLSQGLDNGVLAFRIPSDPERFTDLSSACLRVECRIVKPDGGLVTADTAVFLERNGIHSLFSSCDVRLNDVLVSNMSSYPYSACLCRMLGTSQQAREGIWDEIDGSWNFDMARSNLDESPAAGLLTALSTKTAKSKGVTLIGRVYSDILMSSRQYLPPGVVLGVDLRRAPAAFSLCSTKLDDNYKVEILSASLYVRRLKIRPGLANRAIDSIRGGAPLIFNRLDTRIMAIPSGSVIWRWPNCLNNGSLPNRMYIGFVDQASLYGTIHQVSTYFECLNMASLSVKLNGRDLLVEPIRCDFGKDADGRLKDTTTYAREGFLTVVDIVDHVRDQAHAMRLAYRNWLFGFTIFAIELGKCGEKGGSASGSVDLEVVLAH